jgi:hypothetical protein
MPLPCPRIILAELSEPILPRSVTLGAWQLSLAKRSDAVSGQWRRIRSRRTGALARR